MFLLPFPGAREGLGGDAQIYFSETNNLSSSILFFSSSWHSTWMKSFFLKFPPDRSWWVPWATLANIEQFLVIL